MKLHLQFTQKVNQIDMAGRVTVIGQEGSGFTAMLCAVVDNMNHRLPEYSLKWSARGVCIEKETIQSFIRNIFDKRHQLLFFVCPARL